MPPRHLGADLKLDPVEIERDFRIALREWDMRPTGDGRVSEAVAGELLGYEPGTMRNKRMAGQAPRAFKLVGKIWYRLPDLADWLKRNIEEA